MKEEVFSVNDKNDNLGLGALMAFLPFLFFLPLVMKDKKFSPYCMHRANQSLIVLLIAIVLTLAAKIIGIIGIIPVIGEFIAGGVGTILGIVSAVFYLHNLILAILGSGKRVFIFGMIDILK